MQEIMMAVPAMSSKNIDVEIELDDIAEIGSVNDRRFEDVTAAGDAVVVRNARKSYTKGQPVLNGLNMTVPCGTIYSLLGSSGCGKTTLLSCIVGIKKLDKGKIWVFGTIPGTKNSVVPGRTVGYQPQDLSLYLEFTIAETLNYFGILSGMTKKEIQDARKFLVNLLDLPEDSRQVGSLSGGQQRRVSLVAALIGDPELLILDEPTVGVDPLIRQNIWSYLGKLVQRKKTIVISSHYISECRSSHTIGFMRSGKLLVERNTEELMSEYESNNLEKIVLDLSRRDNASRQFNVAIADVDGSPKSYSSSVDEPANMATVKRKSQTGVKDALSRIRALTGKNFVILYRNPLLLFFVLLIAAVLVVILCFSLGQDPKGLPVALLNKEVTDYAKCKNITRVVGECTVEMLSCHYLRHLNKDVINLNVYKNEEEALESVHSATNWGYIAFPQEFSLSFYERLVSGVNPDELALNASNIVVRLDESNKQISLSIKKTLYDAYEDFISTFLSDCGYDPRQGESVFKYRTPIFGTDTTDFREFLAAGAILAIIFFFPIITTSIRFIKEKKSGVLHRSIVGGVQTWEIMVAYSISEFCVLLFQAILNYAVIAIIFKIKILGDDILVIILYLLSGYGGVSMGFMLGSICTEEIQAAMLAMAAFFPNMLLSGIIWPIEGMIVPMQYVAQIFPCAMAAEAARSITSRGLDLSNPRVWPGFVILTAYIFGYFALTVLFHVIFKR